MPNGLTPAQRPSRLTIAIVPGIVTLIVIAISFISIVNLRESRRLVEHTHEVRNATTILLSRIVDAETGVRAFALSLDDTYLATYNGAEQDTRRELDTLKLLTRTFAI
jgi:CHASE3 domain sensor protein